VSCASRLNIKEQQLMGFVREKETA
jgi:hypothetical protein